jgi:hypothetical protein
MYSGLLLITESIGASRSNIRCISHRHICPHNACLVKFNITDSCVSEGQKGIDSTKIASRKKYVINCVFQLCACFAHQPRGFLVSLHFLPFFPDLPCSHFRNLGKKNEGKAQKINPTPC